ncbi:nitroimidazol reductase NimA-like FMN-containing flavoprotein (pyridoxamine 5'-phosphate oxidase superfamily) [Marmoricola sp. OAE513]|uniref:pyridoxamine 5'-phosphate oxidase family protein n=1 Tax=Marmoricola sp. OAE513 TaxID=2817894 RepID=UPI001AEB9D7F
MTDRTRIRRLPEKAATELEDLWAVLDSARVAHVAFVADGRPLNIPTAYARDGDRLLLHGSTGSRLFRTLAAGIEVCATVTILDGMVLARSALESSMHYRSAMVFGKPETVAAEDKTAALEAMSEAWMPGRWPGLRQPTTKELAGTMVLALPLTEWSVKISDKDVEDLPEDLDHPVWAGTLPILTTYGDPVPADDLRQDIAVPDYLAGWTP